jgi:hypothetical protein
MNSDNNDNESLSRRKLITALGMIGAGAVAAGYQGCSDVGFNSNMGDSSNLSSGDPDPGPSDPLPTDPNLPACMRPLNLYDAPTLPPSNAEAVRVLTTNPADVTFVTAPAAGIAADHHPNARFYKVDHFEHQSGGAQKVQHLLTVDVAHQIASNSFSNLNFITDILIYRQNNTELLHWKRVGSGDKSAHTMIVLDPALVAASAKLWVVVRCLTHKFIAQEVDLGQAPLDYATSVGNFVAGTPFGGSTVHRPYVSVNATGGQGNLGTVHSPHFHSVNNGEVQVTLGPVTGRHGRAGENHYICGGALYDQSGNQLSWISEVTYAEAVSHNLVFSGLNLSGRNVKYLRAVVFDTTNGILQGFYKVS